MEFAGKVALVTGAGSGIGAATARRLARNGATVAVLDLKPDRVAAICAEIAAAGGTALPVIADVADETSMHLAITQLTTQTGRLDMIVANAGINGTWAPIDEITPEEWDLTVRVNLRGTYLTLHFGVPHLKAAKGGAIVIVASINGTRTFTTAGATAYSAAKAGQAAIGDMLAVELGRHAIRVNTVCPGSTRTSISQNTWKRNIDSVRVRADFPDGDIPLTGHTIASPEAIADAVCLLLSDDARHITGTRLYVDGGQSLLR
ncbi:MAG: SDR family NAD(P)-dependent oxidoreductase [bacterium]